MEEGFIDDILLAYDLLLFPLTYVLGVSTDHLEDNSKSSSPYSLANALSIADFEALEYNLTINKLTMKFYQKLSSLHNN